MICNAFYLTHQILFILPNTKFPYTMKLTKLDIGQFKIQLKSKFIKPHICSGMIFAYLGRVFFPVISFSCNFFYYWLKNY